MCSEVAILFISLQIIKMYVQQLFEYLKIFIFKILQLIYLRKKKHSLERFCGNTVTSEEEFNLCVKFMGFFLR